MAIKDINELKGKFADDKEPNGADFGDFMDSFYHRSSRIQKNNILGLNDDLIKLEQEKANKADLADAVTGTNLLGERDNEAAIKAITTSKKGDTYKANDTGYYWKYNGENEEPYSPDKWLNIGDILPSDAVKRSEVQQTIVGNSDKPISQKAISAELLVNNLVFLLATMTTGAIKLDGSTDATASNYNRSATRNTGAYHVQKGKAHYYTGRINNTEYCGVIYLDSNFNFIGYQCAGVGDYVNYLLTVPDNAVYIASCAFGGDPLLQCEADVSKLTKVSEAKAEKTDVLNVNIANSLLFANIGLLYNSVLPYKAYEGTADPKTDVNYILQTNTAEKDTIRQNPFANNWVSYFSTDNKLKEETKAVVLNCKINSLYGASMGVGLAVSENRAIVYTGNGAIVAQNNNTQSIIKSGLDTYTTGDALSFIVEIKDNIQTLLIYKNTKLVYTYVLSGDYLLADNNKIGLCLRGVIEVEFEKIKQIKLNFKSGDAQAGSIARLQWVYNNADHATTQINQYTVVPDHNPDNNQIAGNTGLGYNPNTKEFVIAFYNYAYASKLWLYRFKDLTEYATTPQLSPKPTKEIDVSNYLYHIQGCDYDSEFNCYWLIGAMTEMSNDTQRVIVAVNDNGELLDYFPLSDYDFQAGMLAVYGKYIYIKPNNKRVLYKLDKRTKALVDELQTPAFYNEGFGINKLNGNIWLATDEGLIREYNNDLTAQLGEYQNITFGNEVEAIVIDPADDTVWINADTFLHGANQNGNGLWHADFKKTYNKFVRFPESIGWNAGTLSDGVKIIDNKLIGTGSWESPILDLSAYTDYKNSVPELLTDANVLIEYRGSNTMPDTIKSGAKIEYFKSWGNITPSAYSNNKSFKYIQIRITF